jgi:uncharacterized lipoprotein YajG
MGIRSSLVFLGAVSLLSSCAHTNLTLDQNEFKPFKEYQSKTEFPSGSEVLDMKVIDSRESKQFLGMGKTGASYSDTPLTMPQGASVFISNYFTENLKARGLSLAGSSNVELEIIINKLWVDELIEKYKGERAKCNVEFQVYGKKELETFKGSYWTTITSGGDLTDGTDLLAPTLASCLNEAIEKIVNDQKLVEFINSKI